jgi:hypothetical protein
VRPAASFTASYLGTHSYEDGFCGFSSEIDYNRTLGLAHKDATFFNGW